MEYALLALQWNLYGVRVFVACIDGQQQKYSRLDTRLSAMTGRTSA